MTEKYFEKWTGEKSIVNNRTGGAGMVGHTYLATQAPKDGHTVGIVANLLFADSMLRAQGRWTYNDFDAIAYLNADALSLAFMNDGPLKGKTFKDVIQMAKDKPSTIRIATVPNSFFEYAIDQVESASGTKFLKVPFQGGGPGIAAMLGGNVDISLGFFSELRGHIGEGRVGTLAVTSGERSPNFATTPTLNESLGVNDIIWQATRWAALPKGVAADRRAYLVAALGAATRDPELQAEFKKLGGATRPDFTTPQQISDYLNKLADAEQQFYKKSGRMK